MVAPSPLRRRPRNAALGEPPTLRRTARQARCKQSASRCPPRAPLPFTPSAASQASSRKGNEHQPEHTWDQTSLGPDVSFLPFFSLSFLPFFIPLFCGPTPFRGVCDREGKKWKFFKGFHSQPLDTKRTMLRNMAERSREGQKRKKDEMET